MNVNAMGRSAARYDDIEGGGRELRAARPAGTLITALNTVAESRNRLLEVADEAERIAATMAGASPGATGGGEKAASSSGSIAEDLNERAEALQDPIFRIQGALARISRSVGV